MKRILGLLVMEAVLLIVLSGCGRMTENGGIAKETYAILTEQAEDNEVVQTTEKPTQPMYESQTTEKAEIVVETTIARTTEKLQTTTSTVWVDFSRLGTTKAKAETTVTTAKTETNTENVAEVELTAPPAPWMQTTTETLTVPIEPDDITNPPIPIEIDESNELEAPDLTSVPEVPTADFSSITNEVQVQKGRYPNMHIGVGLYALDGTQLYGYNEYETMAAGCTVKAYYAKYVLEQCEENSIDIETTQLTYESKHRNSGSGVIKDKYSPGTQLSIKYLLTVLLSESDNTAYNILIDRFGLYSFQEALNQIGGQKLGGLKYGNVSVEQRKNEWIAIWQYINSNAQYAETLRSMLSNTKYCYLVQGMNNWHSYLHKSGWIESSAYTCAADCAIIDDKYLLIVLTYDAKDDVSNASAVKQIGKAAEIAINTAGIF